MSRIGRTFGAAAGLAGVLLLSAVCTASAQEPAGAAAALDVARKACRQAKGLRLVVEPEAIRSIDLTGDGRADYIVDFERTRCERQERIFCGTGGCVHAIVVALPDGKFRQVFRQQVLRYTVEPGDGPRVIRFDLHGAYCRKTGPEPCSRRQRITTRPFRFLQP